jgi:hypothetical protein
MPRLSGNPAAHWPSWQGAQPQQWPYGGSAHPPYGGVGYRGRSPYLYGFFPWSSYGYGLPLGYGLSYGSEAGDVNSYAAAPQPPADEPQAEYGPEPAAPEVADSAAPVFRPAYQGQGEFAPVHAQPTTTLIFKDGRPPVQVHNYALTGTMLYALDGDTRQEIPLDLLNVPATVAANRAAGVDFSLPESH